MKIKEKSTPLIFSSIENKSQENEIDSILQRRQQNFMNEENFSKIKENTMSDELSLGINFRNKIFMKKRMKQNINIETTQSLKNKLTIPLDLFEKCENMNVELSKFSEILSSFRTQKINQKYLGLVGIRKLLLLSPSPIQELIDIGIVPEIISLLDNSPAEFQNEALRCLTILSEGTSDQISIIVSKGVIPKIVTLMDSSIEELKIQACFIIGNLANDCPKVRDTLIKEKGYDKLLTILSSTNLNSLIKPVLEALSCFFKVKPIPPYNIARKSYKSIGRAISKLQGDSEFLLDAFSILSFMTENYKDAIKDFLEFDLIESVIKCLDINDQYIILYCLRIIGNIASGNANQTQLLIDANALSYLKKTLMHPVKTVRKETAWIISNIAAGTQKQIETLISENFLPILEKIIENDEIEIIKESIWAICNLTSAENPEFIKKILNQNILLIINNCLRMDNAKSLAVCLEALNNLLAFGRKSCPNGPNPIVLEIEKIGMCEILENLQYHPVEVVYEKTLKLLETFFETQFIE
jgi:importin subunit alpha-2